MIGSKHEAVLNQYFEGEGLGVIGYRDVPVNKEAVAQHVANTMPLFNKCLSIFVTLKI